MGCLAASAQAVQITDDRGKAFEFKSAPARIVSLLPSLTESVCALGQCERLVGTDRYSNWPESVTRLPKLGGGIDPNIEAVVALKPDLVLMSTSGRGRDRLESLGFTVVALEPRRLADAKRMLDIIGSILHVPPEQGALRTWREIDAAVQAARQSLPARVNGVRVYFEVSRGPYAAGEKSFMGEILSQLGARNVVPASLGPFPRLNPEFIVRANPDVIMIGNRSMQEATSYPGWNAMKAVREKRVCSFDAAESDVLVRPGPRMAEAARIMARCLADKAP
ncbi:ABC transporter substrate-binding protein [Diaphorobacter aerolatus]|uniref:ABC transporter substrate-binding protein n=1 Tax=Diaphorobacter aerolatus TaxID=1288495 RepID=A0A7H0GQR7_9BURK|nr:helical backbone metal receptor [Diaphorobacter aerolatus]QNP50633.1 ABC transporter substrate-binding protein [Diaphorobacter aerolatus]